MAAYRSPCLHCAVLRLDAAADLHAAPRALPLLAALQKEGEALVAQDGRKSRVGSGDIFVLDTARPFHVEGGELLIAALYLPADSVRRLVPDIGDLTALTVSSHDGPGALYRAVADELLKLTPSLGGTEAERIADMLSGMLALTLSTLEPKDKAARTRLRQFHRERVSDYIQRQLGNAALNASMIAAAHNLSVRYLYQLFEDEELTLMQGVWLRRLESCRRELAAPALRGRSISQIAYSWGFSDVAHFSRAFRECYDCSPRDYRKRAQMERG